MFFLLCLTACGNDSKGGDSLNVDAMASVDVVQPDSSIQDASMEPVGVPCEVPTECPDGDCINGACQFDVPQACGNGEVCPDGEMCSVALFGYCATPCESEGSCPLRPRPCTGTECPRAMTCFEGRCVNECITDIDCGPGHCHRGVCRTFPNILNGEAAKASAEPAQLLAGQAVLPLRFPVGVSLSGYGGREGVSTPYNKSLGGSDRVLERQDVRVLALSTDKELLIILRAPLCWSTDYLRTLTAVKLQAMTVSDTAPNGINYLDKLVMVATHSHSQPGRFWHLVPELGLGFFGFGSFSMEIVDRYAEDFALTIKKALENMVPAKIGWQILDDFDPMGRIHSNRRGQGPDVVDDRMMVWRVEDLDGVPIAGLVNLAIHGTHMEDTWVTGDVAGAIENVATKRLSEAAGRLAPVLFVNGNAGNVSPRGDDVVDVGWGKIQVVGHRVYEQFQTAWDSIVTRADVHLELVTRRIPVTYDLLGYDGAESEFRDSSGAPYVYGGYFCMDNDTPAGGWMDGALGCRVSGDLLGWPIPNIHKAVLSAIRLDDLVVTTLPGEPTSSLGLRLAAEVEGDAHAAGYPNVRSITFGYSQAHHLYLLEPDDWWQGGYEGSNNWFGWQLGSYFVKESRSLTHQLFTEETEANDTGIKPMWWPDLEDDTVAPTSGGTAAGTIENQPILQLTRGDLLEIAWSGGHPGVDLPKIVLQSRTEEGWQDAHDARGLALDDSGFESITIYEGDYASNHRWTFRLEIPFDLPVGDYRAHVVGHAVSNGPEATAGYEAITDAFFVHVATLMVFNLTRSAGDVSLHVTYPDGPSTDLSDMAFGSLEPLGTRWRHGDRSLPASARRYAFVLGGPLDDPLMQVRCSNPEGGIVFENQAISTVLPATRQVVTARSEEGVVTAVEVTGWPMSRVNFPASADAEDCILTDVHGNQTTVSLTDLP